MVQCQYRTADCQFQTNTIPFPKSQKEYDLERKRCPFLALHPNKTETKTPQVIELEGLICFLSPFIIGFLRRERLFLYNPNRYSLSIKSLITKRYEQSGIS